MPHRRQTEESRAQLVADVGQKFEKKNKQTNETRFAMVDPIRCSRTSISISIPTLILFSISISMFNFNFYFHFARLDFSIVC